MRVPPWLCKREIVAFRVPASEENVEATTPESDVRDTGDQHSSGTEHADDLGRSDTRIGQVFEDLEAQGRIERIIVEGKLGRTLDPPGIEVVSAGEPDRRIRDVDSDIVEGMLSNHRSDRRAVPAADVQQGRAGREIALDERAEVRIPHVARSNEPLLAPVPVVVTAVYSVTSIARWLRTAALVGQASVCSADS
jgi:hypothetical protein